MNDILSHLSFYILINFLMCVQTFDKHYDNIVMNHENWKYLLKILGPCLDLKKGDKIWVKSDETLCIHTNVYMVQSLLRKWGGQNRMKTYNILRRHITKIQDIMKSLRFIVRYSITHYHFAKVVLSDSLKIENMLRVLSETYINERDYQVMYKSFSSTRKGLQEHITFSELKI